MGIKPMNCIIIEDEADARRLVEAFVQKTKMLKLIGSYATAIEALNSGSTDHNVDLVLLDIELPEMSGMEYLRSLNVRPIVIVLSGQEKYALEAFEYDVTDYILKPVIYSRFYKAISKAYLHWRKDQNFQLIHNENFIRKGGMLVRLPFSDIFWIEALENYVVIRSGREKHSIHFTLKAIRERLPSDLFIQVHRSYIVNIQKIDSIKKNSLLICIGEEVHEIPIGKIYRQELLSYLNLLSY